MKWRSLQLVRTSSLFIRPMPQPASETQTAKGEHANQIGEA
jgi:hypothetical protein